MEPTKQGETKEKFNLSNAISELINGIKYDNVKKIISLPQNEYMINDLNENIIVNILDNLNTYVDNLNNLTIKLIGANQKVTSDIASKFWQVCEHIYKNVLKPISEFGVKQEEQNPINPEHKPTSTLNTTEKTYTKTTKYTFRKNANNIKNHKFFKNFLMGPLLRLNYHYLKGANEKIILKPDDIKKIFHGFNTCICIFENLDNKNNLRDKINEYIKTDEKIVIFVSENTDNGMFKNIQNAYDMVKELKLEQILSLIDLCHINKKRDDIEKIIERLTKEEIIKTIEKPGEKGEPYPQIPESFMNLFIEKLRKVNAINQENFDERDEGFTDIAQVKSEPQNQGRQRILDVRQKQTGTFVSSTGTSIPTSNPNVGKQQQGTLDSKITKGQYTATGEPKKTEEPQQKSSTQINKGDYPELNKDITGGNDYHKYIKYKSRYLSLKKQ